MQGHDVHSGRTVAWIFDPNRIGGCRTTAAHMAGRWNVVLPVTVGSVAELDVT
jgi:hypothetical protein